MTTNDRKAKAQAAGQAAAGGRANVSLAGTPKPTPIALFALQPAQETSAGFPTGDYTKAAKDAGLSGERLAAWQKCTDKGTYVDYVKSVDDASVKKGITGTPVIEVAGTKLNWGGLIDQNTREADTATLTKILTSGTVPADLVQKP